jgi:hypothetical protein
VLRRVVEPLVRDFDDELLLRDEVPRVEELERRVVPPVATFAAFCAALAAWSKSFFSEVPNLVESRRASATNLPRPLYSVLVPAAASLPDACLRRSVSAFWAEVSDWLSRLSAAGSLKVLLRREEDREDFRAWGIPVS